MKIALYPKNDHTDWSY